MDKMREIGGYIELDKHYGSLLHDSAVGLNCGRAALEYLIRANSIKKIYMPYFCCDSVAQACRRCGTEYEYYHIDGSFRPVFEKKLEVDERLYIINYYGQLNNDAICTYKEKYKNIIVDNAQAYFQMPVPGVDTLYTCRKFFGVSDGAFLYTERLIDGLPQDESFERIHYILGRFERTASEFYQESVLNNKLFADEPLKKMSKLTENILRTIDYEKVKSRRTENFLFLHDNLSCINRLELTVPEGAFMYPLYIKGAHSVRKVLQQNKIYIPVLWPDVFSVCDSSVLEYDLAENILPLPIDQRYCEDDMKTIICYLNDI